jgi:uncharacterized membrane-anchored protein
MDHGKRMVKIFLIQLLAAGFGAVSTALADWSYARARIGLRLHRLWVAVSIAVIGLPVLTWISIVFLGPGIPSQLAAAIFIGSIFFWVYHNLPKPPPIWEPDLPSPSNRVAAPTRETTSHK